jgi:transcriptional regulator with XRE-family HTH domain
MKKKQTETKKGPTKAGKLISAYRDEKCLSQLELVQELAKKGIIIQKGSVSNWENGVATPPLETFMALCQIFEIPDIMKAYFGSNPLSPFHGLNDKGMEKMLEYRDLLLASHLYDEQTTTEVIPFATRRIKLFQTMASAGTGNFIDGDDYEWYEAGDEVPQEADFGVRLSGDSMEPRFINHQTVWVHQQDTLQNGEIGIFFLNGSAYCKKLGTDEGGVCLISLNPKSAPIRIKDEDTFKTFGRVVG